MNIEDAKSRIRDIGDIQETSIIAKVVNNEQPEITFTGGLLDLTSLAVFICLETILLNDEKDREDIKVAIFNTIDEGMKKYC